jgi:hypothetical protein
MGWKVQGKHYKYLPSSFVQCPFQIVLFACALGGFYNGLGFTIFLCFACSAKRTSFIMFYMFYCITPISIGSSTSHGWEKVPTNSIFSRINFFFKLTYHQKRIKQCSIWGAGGTGCLVLPNVQLVIVSLFMVMSIHCSYLLLWVIKWNFCYGVVVCIFFLSSWSKKMQIFLRKIF